MIAFKIKKINNIDLFGQAPEWLPIWMHFIFKTHYNSCSWEQWIHNTQLNFRLKVTYSNIYFLTSPSCDYCLIVDLKTGLPAAIRNWWRDQTQFDQTVILNWKTLLNLSILFNVNWPFRKCDHFTCIFIASLIGFVL